LTLAFTTTLLFGVEIGLLVSVTLSMLFVILRISFPEIAILGRFPGSETTYRNVKSYPETVTYEGLIILRVDASLFFGNTTYLRHKILGIIKEHPNTMALLLDCSGVNDIDSTGVLGLIDMQKAFQKKNITLLFANPTGAVRSLLRKTELDKKFGQKNFFWNIHEGVKYFIDHLASPDVREKITQQKVNENKEDYSEYVFDKEERDTEESIVVKVQRNLRNLLS